MSDFRRVADTVIDFDRVKMIEAVAEGLKVIFEDGPKIVQCDSKLVLDNLCAKPPIRHIPSLDRR